MVQREIFQYLNMKFIIDYIFNFTELKVGFTV